MKHFKHRMPTHPALAGLLAIIVATAAATPAPRATAGTAPQSANTPVVETETTAAWLSGPDADADAALRSLAPHVGNTSHPDALRTAFTAYFNYRYANPDAVRKPYFYYVDLGLDNTTPRGYVFDMDRRVLIDGPFMVAHGRGSARARNGVPTSFSNRPGSYASSLGLYLARETYTFRGKSGGSSYASVGLRMSGESGPFNSAALSRGIVAHGAPYVTAGGAGRSEGCPAMEQHRARRLLPLLANGGVVFIYSPRDDHWLRTDPWID